MKKITLLALKNTTGTTIAGPMDVFQLVNQLYCFSFFEVKVASLDGKPIKCASQMVLQPHNCIKDIAFTDLIIISAIRGDIESSLKSHRAIVPWLLDMYNKGASIASLCTGSFLLAETGLLNGKTATTHWTRSELFYQKYPKIHLKPECTITDEKRLFCSAGAVNSKQNF